MPIDPEIDENETLLLTDEVDDDLEEQDETGEDADETSTELPTFDDDEAEPEAHETPAIRALRKELREKSRRLKQFEEAAPPPAKVELPPKPVWGDGEAWDYDGESFDRARDEWDGKKVEADKADSERQAALAEQNREGAEILTAYQTRAKKLPVKDYAVAAETVEETLGMERASILVAGLPDAEKLIYALGKSPSKLKALSDIKNPVRFAFAAAELAIELRGKAMGTKKAPAPDVAVRGDAGNSITSGDKKLEALEKAAEKSGDRTEIRKYKQQLRAKAN